MAASVSATFKLIDKASGTLDKIEKRAAKATASLDVLGKKIDATGKKVDALTGKVGTLNVALDDLGKKKATARVEVSGTTAAIAQIKAVDAALDNVDRKMRTRAGKGGLISRFFGALPTGGNTNVMAMFGELDRGLNRVTQRLKPFAQAAGGAGGALMGMLGAFPLLVTAAIALTPVIVALTGAVTALGASLIAAVGGAGLIGAGLLGSFIVGIGSVALVVKNAMAPMKNYSKAVQNLNKAMSSGNPKKIAAAQLEVNKLAKQSPGIAKLYTQFQKLKSSFADITAPSRTRLFGVLTNALKTMNTLLPKFGGDIRANFGAAADAFDHLLAMLRGKEWQAIIHALSKIFQDNIGPIVTGIERFLRGIGNLIRDAQGGIRDFTGSFANVMERFVKWSRSPDAQKWVDKLISSFRQWVRLIGSVANLIGALMGQGTKSGDSLVGNLTDQLNTWAEWIRENPKKMRKFFEDAVDLTRKIARFLGNAFTAAWNLGKTLSPIVSALGKLVDKLGPQGLLAILAGYAGVKTAKGAVSGANAAGKLIDRVTGNNLTGLKGMGVGSPANPIVVVSRGSLGGGGPTVPDKGPKKPSAFKRGVDAVKQYGPAAVRTIGPKIGAGGAAAVLTEAGRQVPGKPQADAMRQTTGTSGNAGQDNAANFWHRVGQAFDLVGSLHGNEGAASVPIATRGFGHGGKMPNTGPVSPTTQNFVAGQFGLGAKSGPLAALGTLRKAQTATADNTEKQTKRMRDASDQTRKKNEGDLRAISGAFTTNLSTVKRSVDRTIPAVYTEMQQWLSKINGSVTTATNPAGAMAPGPAGTTGIRPRARGGRIPGQGLQDTVPMGHNVMAAPGELIVNRHTESRVNRILGAFGTSLGGEVGREGLPHSKNAARGGRMPTATTAGLHSGVLKAASSILEHFPGLSITSTTGGRHAKNSYHYLGEAVDIGGSPALMDQAAAWIKSAMGGSLTEGIHNPNLSIKNGRAVPPSFWGANTWAGHANHIHLAIAGALGAIGLGGLTHKMRKRTVGGRGMAQGIGQGAVNKLITAAQGRLDAAGAADGGGGLDGASFGGGGGSLGSSEVSRLTEAVGLPSIFKDIAFAESRFNPNAHNPSGASGLWQIMMPLHAGLVSQAGGNVFDPLTNARVAKMLYDQAGLSPWTASKGLWAKAGSYASKGMRMPEWGGWFGQGGEFVARRPTLIGVGENGAEPVKIGAAATRGGAGIHIDRLTIHGGEDVKNEVIKAFRQLTLQLNLQGAERDSDG